MRVSQPFLQCHPVHSIRGRIRLRLESPYIPNGLAGTVEAVLRDHPAVQGVRLNPPPRSLVLTYDADAIEADDFIRFVQGWTIEQLESHQSQSHRAQQSLEPPAQSWWSLGLSLVGVALGFLAESSVALWCLPAAAVPIFRRAFDAIAQRGKLNVDVLDAAATTVLVAQGLVTTAAAMV